MMPSHQQVRRVEDEVGAARVAAMRAESNRKRLARVVDRARRSLAVYEQHLANAVHETEQAKARVRAAQTARRSLKLV